MKKKKKIHINKKMREQYCLECKSEMKNIY